MTAAGDGRYEAVRHGSRWQVRDLADPGKDGPVHDQQWQAEQAAADLNARNVRRMNPTATLFDKDPAPMTQPSIWDDLDDGDFRRDDSGKPLIIPEDGGEPVPYRRCTSFISAVEDDFGIQQWKRNLAIDGILADPELRAKWDGADWHSKAAVAGMAFVAAGGEDAANRGTRMHTLTDVDDAGDAHAPDVTPAELADLAAYRQAVAHLTLIHAEPKTVLDTLRVAGTPDRIWKHPTWTKPRIGDLKTGKPDPRKWAMQMALYAHSRLYNTATGERTDLDVDLDTGLIIHLPYGEARARILEVDLRQGWEGVQLCVLIHAWRERGMRQLTRPYKTPQEARDPLLEMIAAAPSSAALTALWATNKTVWTDAHTAAAKARTVTIGQQQAAA